MSASNAKPAMRDQADQTSPEDLLEALISLIDYLLVEVSELSPKGAMLLVRAEEQLQRDRLAQIFNVRC